MSQEMSAEEHYKRGIDYAEQNRNEEAIREFKAALLIKPDYAEAHKALGKVYLSQQQMENFIRETETAVRLNPDDIDTHHGLGLGYFSQKRYKEAIREFEIVLRAEPDHKDAHIGLGSTYLSQKRFKEAAREFEAVLRIDPNNSEGHQGLGWAYVWQNQGEPNDRAINEFETAVKCDPNDATAHYNLGMNYARHGRQEEGYRECETAEKLGSKEATQWLDNGTNRIIDQLLSVFRRYAARPSPDTLDAFREKVQLYAFAINARFFDLLEQRIAQGQSSDELSHMRILLSQSAEEGRKMGNQAKPEASFESEKKKADSEWDTYSALERFSLALGDFIGACWLLSVIWHTSLWPIGLFLLAYIPAFVAGMHWGGATRLVNTKRFENTDAAMARAVWETKMRFVRVHDMLGDWERIPATMKEAVGLMERDGPNLAQLLAQHRATARRNVWVGTAWAVIAIGLTASGIMLSAPELLAAQGFVLVLVVVNMLFKIARAKLAILSLVGGLAQLIQIAIGGFALYLILDSMNQPSLFPKLLAIATITVVAYVILESATDALRRAMVFGSNPTRIGSVVIALSYKYFPPFLFWILWTVVPQF